MICLTCSVSLSDHCLSHFCHLSHTRSSNGIGGRLGLRFGLVIFGRSGCLARTFSTVRLLIGLPAICSARLCSAALCGSLVEPPRLPVVGLNDLAIDVS